MVTMRSALAVPVAGLLVSFAVASVGCKKGGAAPALSKEGSADESPLKVPVPPENGPKLAVLRSGVAVHARPSKSSKRIGELAIGASVARSTEPYGKDDCATGWYAVRPAGFVCAAAGVAVDAAAARDVPQATDLARALPYRYGRARADGVPLYVRPPSFDEQRSAEADLNRHLARGEDRDPLGAASTDVPLDPRGIASGPPVLLPTSDGVGADGRRTASSYFTFPGAGAPIAPRPPGSPDEKLTQGTLRKGGGVALVDSVVVESGPAARRFGVTPDGRYVPVDRLRPALGATWHGIDVEKVGLPVAFVHKLGVHTFSLGGGKAHKNDDELERKAVIPLSGKFRTVEGVRFEQTRDGAWLRAQDLVVVVKRTKFPDLAKASQKWVDVSIANQTLTAYEGKKPVYVTLVSTGRDQLSDKPEAAVTARGTFRVRAKHVARTPDLREVHGAFEIPDAPWALELESGNALTGAYWTDGVGEAAGFHDVALTPIDAHRLFLWADPALPPGWASVEDDGSGEGTFVVVRP
jgi:hypothetical protein